MAEDKSIDFLDYLLLVLKWKKFLISLTIIVFIISYGIIYYSIEEQFDSTSVVLPVAEESGLGAASGILKNLKSLPMGLGGKSGSAETDLYITVIYSRTMLENIINKFDLRKDYKPKFKEDAVEMLKKNIDAKITDEKALEITVRANSPKKAAAINEYILEALNSKVIELNVSKSRNNREFLEERFAELKVTLKNSEDSLQRYQESSGIFEAEEQLKLTLKSYSELETMVMVKEAQYNVMKELYTEDNPILRKTTEELNQARTQLADLKKNGRDESMFMAYGSLPQKTKNYIRYYRDVKINNEMLEFIIPLYEQAKFEEAKDLPVVQIIDKPSVPEKKAYPPRLIITLVVTITIMLFAILALLIKEYLRNNNNPKLKKIMGGLQFKTVSSN